jgi:hypothetical protein
VCFNPKYLNVIGFPSGNVEGEFVRKILVAGLLSELDAGAPYSGRILGGGLWFDAEEKAEKISVGFDSKEGFTESGKGGHGEKNKRGGPDPVRQNGKM